MFSLDSYSTTVINSVADPGSTPQAGDVSSIIPADRIRLKRLRPGNNVVLEDMGDAIRIGAHSVSNPEVLMDPADLDILGDDGHTIKRLRAGNHITLTSEPDHIQIDSVGGVAGTGVSSAGAAGGVSLIKQESVIKDLKAGTNVTLDTTDVNCITINATGGNAVLPSLTNAGSGLSWVDDGALHKIRGIQNLGPHLQVTLSEDGKDIQLQDTFVPYTPTVLTSTGGSHTLANATIPLGLKGLSAGTNISITPTDTDVTINNTYSFTETPLTTSGTGTSLRKSDHVLKDLKAGSLITLSTTEDDVTIQGVAPPALTSTGTGNTSLVGSTTQSLKSLQAGTNINLVTDGDTVTLHNTYSYTPPAPTVLTNAGTNGTSLVGSAAQSIKSLVPGSNVTLTTNGDEVTVAAATQTFTETPITTSGTGTSILQSGHVLKDLKAGNNITITNTTNDVTIAADTQTFTETPITTTGTGTSVLQSGHILKDLKAGSNITITSTTNDVTIAAATQTFTETPTTSAGSTGGSSLINADHVIKDLKAGSNVTLDTTDAKCITINSAASITTTGTGTSILQGGTILKDLKAVGSASLTNTTSDVTLNTPIIAVGTDLTSYSSVTGGVTTLTVGKCWPRPVASYDPIDYDSTCQDGSTIRSTPAGGTIASMVNKQYQIVSAAGWGHISFNIKIPYTIYPYGKRRPCIQNTTPTATDAIMTVSGYDPFVANVWMICTLAIQYRTPTVLFQKSGEVGQPRISLGMETNTNKRWRVTVSNDGYTPGMYWEPTEIPLATGDDTNVWTYAFCYLSKVGDDAKCNQVRLKIQGSAIVTSPLFGDTGWVAETGGSLITSITLTTKNITYPNEEGTRTTKHGIGGNTWWLFNSSTATPVMTQSWYLFWLYFYPPMTDDQLNAAYAYHNRISN